MSQFFTPSVLVSCRITVRFLKESRLLDSKMQPCNLAHFASHLHYHGAGVFLFCRLLVSNRTILSYT